MKDPNNPCLFCDIKKSGCVHENELAYASYDTYPVTEHHCLIIPKRVYPDYFDSTLEELKGLNELIFKTKEFLDNKYQPTGYNIGVNSGEDSGQTVFHLHIHLIPRYKGDVDDPRGGVRGVIPSKQKY